MPEPIDVFWSFRSPYSYLATFDLLQLREDFDVEIDLRVVLPLAIRQKGTLFNPSNTKPFRYIQLDWERRAEFLGRPHCWPSPDPIVQDLETHRVAQVQPYIYQLSKLGVEAQRCGKGLDFAANVSREIFGGTRNWHKGRYLSNAAAAVGLDLATMQQMIEEGDHLEEIERNHSALEEVGHWGVPTMVVRDEPFFGQDRIETLRWHLSCCGLGRV
jgi:2-hydroxychromene-2-carboxylate isomerase